jgi:hypothetical protein
MYYHIRQQGEEYSLFITDRGSLVEVRIRQERALTITPLLIPEDAEEIEAIYAIDLLECALAQLDAAALRTVQRWIANIRADVHPKSLAGRILNIAA